MGDTSPRRFLSFLTQDSMVITWLIKLTLPSVPGTRDGLPTKFQRRRSQAFPLLIASITSSFLPSVFLMLPSVFRFPTSTTSRESVKLFAEPLNKELSDLVTKLDLYHPISRVRRFSPSNSTRRFLTLLDQVTLLVFQSRVSQRTKRLALVTSSTTKRTVNSSPSSLSPPWSLSKSTLVFSSLVTVLLSSLVPPRLRAR